MINFFTGRNSVLDKYVLFYNTFDEKLCDFIEGWEQRLLWKTYDDFNSYINSPTFMFTAFYFFLIPVSELALNGTVVYFYMAVAALIFDLFLFYLLMVVNEPKVPGLAATAARIFSFAFFLFTLEHPEFFPEFVRLVFPGEGDYIITSQVILGEMPVDSPEFADKKELVFRLFWGLGHIILFAVFFQGFRRHWRRGLALRAAAVGHIDDLELSFDMIFKRSLAAGVIHIWNSIEKYPTFWALPTFLFIAMADFSSFAKSPYLLYTSMSTIDCVRVLTYDLTFVETALWWCLTCAVLVYLGDFKDFSHFFTSAKSWVKEPLVGANIYKLLTAGFFLVILPFFWIVTDNDSFNSFFGVTILDNFEYLMACSLAGAVTYFIGAFIFFLLRDSERSFVRCVFISTCCISLLMLAFCLSFHFDHLNNFDHPMFFTFNLFEICGFGAHELFQFGFDYTSIILCLMTSVIFCLVMYFSMYANIRYKVYYFSCLYYLLVLILLTFLSLNLFSFYMFFEATIVPVGLLIMQWGFSDKRYFAARQYVFYSVVSGLPLMAGLGYLYNIFGSLDYLYILNNLFILSYNEQLYLWFAFFFVFAVKVPLFPFHSWLLNAHVEASTGVSIILAAVLLKIGAFGIIRYLLGIFHLVSSDMSNYVCFFALLGIVYSSLCAITEVDLKRLIAFTSIAHMNFAVIGLFMFDESAFYGAVVTLLAHSAVSAALFFIIGVLYSRVHAREIIVYGGLIQLTPILCSFLFFFAIANAGFPCSLSFVGELFLFMAFFKKLGFVFISLLCLSSILLLYANLRLFVYVSFGTINDNYIAPTICDFGHMELVICFMLFLNAFVPFVIFDHFFYPLFGDFLIRYFV